MTEDGLLGGSTTDDRPFVYVLRTPLRDLIFSAVIAKEGRTQIIERNDAQYTLQHDK